METLKAFLSRHKYDIIRAAAALAANVLILLLLPALVISISPSDAGMMVCITLFFMVDPAFCIAAGIFAGRDLRNRWFTALFPPVTFLISARLIFGADASDFSVYAVIYAAITAIVTLFTFLVMRFSPKEG
ncbi:MAG: hypothetical protein MR291_10310 [Oscillospiraceae bacterium]|nr:hypothetical protein [Oscillospiraceae bacterium]